MNDKTYPPYKFRKKPVVIEAWRIVPGGSPQPSWVREAFVKHEGVTGAIDWDAAGEGMWINTLEGCMTANEGDWLIKGIKGELYACKPDIFEATYEAVDVDADREARGVPQGWKLIKDSTHAERSWPDDVTSGQSLYSCCCAECGRNFNGHKWRACCRVCAEAPPAPAAQAERVPLTEGQIVNLWTKATGLNVPNMGSSKWQLLAIARAVEAAHGIGSRYIATQPTEAQAARDVLAERRRQVEAEGWTPKHDDQHGDGEMARAAATYALYDLGVPGGTLIVNGMRLWPWDWSWLKPKGNRSNLVRAGALILAEIERLDRAATPPQPTSQTGGA